MLNLPPPIWALIYLVAAACVSWLTGWPTFPGAHLVPLGIVLTVGGFAPTLWAATLFRREGTEIKPTSATNAKLVIRGPYAFTRNPMYLGLVIISLGIAFWVGAIWMFAAPVLTFATANWVHIPFEEAKMRRQFGAAFDDYTRKIRRWV